MRGGDDEIDGNSENAHHRFYGTQKKESNNQVRFLFAEREGFEPPVPLGTAVFKTAVIDHSTISPDGAIYAVA